MGKQSGLILRHELEKDDLLEKSHALVEDLLQITQE